MIIQMIMTESTSYLDMNKKKKNFVIQIKPFNSLLFCFGGDFKSNAIDRSLFFFENPTGSQPQNINYSPINFSPTPHDSKKKFHAFPQNNFFHPERDSNSHVYGPHSALLARPPSPARARHRRRCRCRVIT